jgi:biopolymer transport protein ExbD
MARQHHYRRRRPVAETDLDVTTFMNLMVVLVPFLLITAVFSRITVVELTLPSAAGGTAAAKPEFRLEVIVRESGLELTNGESVIAALPKIDGAYDLATLGQMVMTLKRDYPDSKDASVLLEPDIEYDHLIQVMDVVRSAPLPAGAKTSSTSMPTLDDSETPGGAIRVALFTDISIGDAP